MKSLACFSALTAIGLSLTIYACSSNDDPGNFGSGSGGSGTGSTSSSGGKTGTGDSTSKGGTTTIITTTAINPDAACGSREQPAQLTPVYMVFLYDKSGSMGDDPNGQWQNLAKRWTPMKLGMIDFFTKSNTVGIEASLEFFPAPGDKTTTCQADYKTPEVPMTSLQKSQPLVDALERTVPKGGTPTLPAVMGGIAYAKDLMTKRPGSKAVVVLVTDGEPAIYNPDTGLTETDCAPAGSTIENTIPGIVGVVGEAATTEPKVPTYVIGIGEAQKDMAAIATAGGTEYIQLDANQPPETTRSRLTETLNSIRTTQFECSIPIPEAPDFRKDLVNVKFVHTDGKEDNLGKSANCAQPGWFFDDEGDPKKIMLCTATCNSIQADLTGKLQVLLGCPTVIL